MSLKVKFGGTAEEQGYLAQLVLEGKKTATSSLCEIKASFTQIGDIWEIVDAKNRSIVFVEVINVKKQKFQDIDETFAKAEGDGTFENWYNIHWNYYGKLLKKHGLKISEETMLECVWFKKIKN